jgi:hypothetical protein
MVRKIINEKAFMEMARIGFIPIGTTNTVEVYVHTNDAGKVPHFHVRKYGSNNQFEWETCIKYDSANYFVHGHYDDKIPDRKIIKELDKMLRTTDRKDRNNRTYWQKAIDAWNDNNSDVELDLNLEQPDYTKL